MFYAILKAAISGVIIALVSEIARRRPGFGALIASLPLISILGMIWLWRDTRDPIRPADHATFHHIGMLQQHAFDLRRIDIFPAGNDQVLLAVVNEEIAVGVAQANVAGAIPAVMQRFTGGFPVAPIFRE